MFVEHNKKGEPPMKTHCLWATSKKILLAGLFIAALTWALPCHAKLSAQQVASPQKSATGTKTPPQASAVTTPSAALPAAGKRLSREQAISGQQEVQQALLKSTFTYNPKLMVDPFVSFIKPAVTLPLEFPAELGNGPPKPERPLTPLQKMSVGEIQKGLRAITWGGLGRKAIIQDSAGRGYIVGVGTPAVGRNGIVLRIYPDRLIIREEVWNSILERMVYEDKVVKLQKNQGS